MKNKSVMVQRLHDLRQSKGLSIKQLADSLGVSSAAIKKYEYGEREPNSKAMAALEKYFGVTGAYLRGEEDAAPAGQAAAPAVEQYIGAMESASASTAGTPTVEQYIGTMESGETSSADTLPAGAPAADPCLAYSSVKARVEQVICVTVTQSDHSGRLSERRQLYSLDGRLLGVGIDLEGV